MPNLRVDPARIELLWQSIRTTEHSAAALHLHYENPTPDFVLQDCALNYFNDLVLTFDGDFAGKLWLDCLSLQEDAYENTYAVGIDVPRTDPPIVVLTRPVPFRSMWAAPATPASLAAAAEVLVELVHDALPFVVAAEQADTA